MGDAKDISFGELFDQASLQRLQDEFSAATEVASIITYPDGTPITRPSGFCRLCEKIIRCTDVGRANCYRSDAFIGRYHPEGPVVQTCLRAGLWDAGVSLTVGDRHVANWRIGQVRDAAQGEEKIREYARMIGADEMAVLDAYREIPVMSFEQFHKIARMLFTVASQLSLMAYQNVQQARFIVERQQAEAELRKSESRYRGLVTLAVDGILLGSHEGIIIEVNDCLCALTGLSKEELVGKHIRELMFTPQSLALAPLRFDRLHQGEVVVSERTLVRPDGGEIVIEMRTKQMPDGTYQSILRDITDRKQAEDILKKAKEAAEASNGAKTEFLTNMAHDFRTPMHAIMGFSGFLQSEHLTDRQKKFAAIINQRSQSLLRLIEDILDVSRLESGRLELRQVDFDPGKAVKATVAAGKAELMKPAVTLSCVIDASIPLVKGDELRFTQIVTNLMSNAIQYTDKGGITVAIERIPEAGSTDQCRIKLSVKDPGPGIPEDIYKKIFNAFTGLNQGVGWKDYEGVGLGLYITKTLVDLMKGEITGSSHPGAGSEFVVVLDFNVVDGGRKESAG